MNALPLALSLLVNPFIGTDYTGNTYPGATVPFGMVQLSPDNGTGGWDRIAGYFYPDSTIAGFSHTHLQGTGAGDLYDVSFLPVTFPLRLSDGELGIHSRFSHERESAHAGYYRVHLDDYGIDVELTADTRTGVQRYTFPDTCQHPAVILNLHKAMNWDRTVSLSLAMTGSDTFEGHRHSDGWARDQHLWFAGRFSVPPLSVDTLASGQYIFRFPPLGSEPLVVATAISGVDPAGARANLEAEAPRVDFDATLSRAQSRWDNLLGRIRIADGDTARLRTFYTALYHALSCPTTFSDVDGRYTGPDRLIHTVPDSNAHYSTFSLWDTYRAAHPLYTIICPDTAAQMCASIVDFGIQHRHLPVWNMWASETEMMIGYHAASVLAEAHAKGIGGFDPAQALELCLLTATDSAYRGLGSYMRLGYVPYDSHDPYNENEDWSLSRTLEYACDDAAIARLAASLGRDSIADAFRRRSYNFVNLFDPETRFFRPRDSHGRFQPDFSPEAYTPHICESNAWQYLWAPVHALDSLTALMGGQDRFAERLHQFFTLTDSAHAQLPIFSTGMIGQYAHGNEPSHHAIYLNNLIGRRDLTARLVRQVVDSLYSDTPAGLCGNEDCGQMSAWYVFSALGFYPLDPSSGLYELGTPLFDRVTISLDDNRTLDIVAERTSPGAIYVHSVLLNGRPLQSSAISHADLIRGGELRFILTDTP